MLNFLSDNTAIITLLALTLLVLLLLGVVVWAAMKGAGEAGKPAPVKPRLLSADSLKQSFRVAVELIENNLAARGERYNLNWTLVLNEGKHGRELPLVQSGLQSALSADSTLTASGQGISWNFFDSGVAIQLQTEYLGSPDPADENSNNTWDDFLGLCRNYRPDRPFDAIVLSIPATAFLEGGGQGQLDLIARAKAIHRRLWLAQNRLALRFPIYLAISECESIPGFARFAAALPEPLRRSMLGWSSAYELSAPFQAQWVDNAMNDMVRTLSDTGAELCALEPAGSDSSEYFLLPTQVERLRAGLKLFTEELMRPSAYHEPFLLRGIYMTGDCSESAVLVGEASLLAEDTPALDPYGPVTLIMAEPEAPLAPPLAEELAPAPAARTLLAAQAGVVPAFLRDIFERKIFAESGLVRSASSQRMRRPAMGRLLRWSAIAVPAIWIVGLGVASFRLDHMSNEMVGYLKRLDQGSNASLAVGQGRAIDAAESRQRTIDALLNIEKMESTYMGSFFMPGSWSWFDSLHDRLERRMEKGFADNAFDPLRRATYARVSQLTGAPVDPVSGSLIVGAQCTLPLNWAQNTAGVNTALNVEDLPEFGATLQYLAQIEQTEKLLAAMMRLKDAGSGPASGEDLELMVSMLLGHELNGGTARTAALFRQVAQQVSSLTMEPLREAASCSLKHALKATTVRLFDRNGLLASERAIGESTTALIQAGPRPADPGNALLAWQKLRNALRDQENYMVAGKGAWMHANVLTLGPAWENMLQRIELNGLLGSPAAEDARRQAEAGFARFEAAWLNTLGADSLFEGLNAGLEWSQESNGWTFGESRKALLESLGNLLGQPYMKFNSMSRFPDVPLGATVAWDTARLDQVLALADARKRFQVELMPKFPAPLQSSASALADAGLLATARDLLSQAYYVSANDVQAPVSEAGRTRALRVRSWLDEIGAGTSADALGNVLARDALSRLQLLDDTLNRAQVFVPRDRAFRSWVGARGPLLEAFGAPDAGALSAYVAQQQSFIDAIGRDAEALLLQLGSNQLSNPLVARWQVTVADLARYRLKSPTSTLMALEQFVLMGAADIELNNCLDKLSSRAAQRRGTDVFSERMQILQAGLYTRCRELTQTGFEDAWTRFADAFNRDLSNRAPFRAVMREAAIKGERAPAADVEEVGSVFKLFDRVRVLGIASDRDTSRPSAPASMKKVDEQMQKVRDFLAPLFPTEDGQAAGFDVAVEFRANSAAESEGNKIIDWSMTIGSQTLRQRDPARPLRWEPGIPVTLSLRFARDGPVAPVAEAGHPGMTVDERTVSYRFDDPWALLSFISSYRQNETSAAARSQLLKFEFPLNEIGQNGILARAARARLFVRMTISPAGKRSPLIWPSVFPTKVPGW